MEKLRLLSNLILALACLGCTLLHADTTASILSLKLAYPKHISEATNKYVAWHDGTRMPIAGGLGLLSWFKGKSAGKAADNIISKKDVLHARFEPVFKKMYGKSSKEVRRNLVTIYWMPHAFGTRYPLRVTTVNGVDKKLRRISANLEKLPPRYYKYLENPGGSFYWRKVKGESALSTHSFGIALDINLRYSNYWLWDFKKTKKPLSDLRTHPLTVKNRIPMEIVDIFEKEGFFWGGRWYFYDTMHFEYRPDLLL
mgnify:CR=1 FL=1|tara:strand:+ start:6509 stop:7273 length:765 start_codon:yes stop_codon:yes gene_type:complete